MEDLPSVVNVPSVHLEHFDESETSPEPEPPKPPAQDKPKLRLM
jgi:hypothetical protein